MPSWFRRHQAPSSFRPQAIVGIEERIGNAVHPAIKVAFYSSSVNKLRVTIASPTQEFPPPAPRIQPVKRLASVESSRQDMMIVPAREPVERLGELELGSRINDLHCDMACCGYRSARRLGAEITAEKAGATYAAPDREFDVQGFHVRVDVRDAVIAIDVPEDRGFAGDRDAREEAPVLPTLPATGGFVSASVLAQKAKQFDDGLYAAVEQAAQNGAGSFAGKDAMLKRVARILSGGGTEGLGDPGMVLFAACKLGDVQVDAPRELNATVQSAVNEFLADELRSKPVGFYTWSPALSGIFRQDRMLQTELKGEAGIATFARALHADKAARATYEEYLSLVSRLTNPLSGRDLRGVLQTLDSGGAEFPSHGVVFFPTSRAHETGLIKKLYMDKPIPQGFSLIDEMMKRIRSKQIDVSPTASSGWYDYQTWSLETLVAPDRAAEAVKLKLEESYRKQLEELFRGVLALIRETHIKQLEVPAPAPGQQANRNR